MSGKDCSQVDCTRTLRTIEAPYCFGPGLVHIHGFRSVAPTGSHSDTQPDTFALKLLLTGSRFPYSTNGGIGKDTLDRRTIGLAKLRGIERGQSLGHVHSLRF